VCKKFKETGLEQPVEFLVIIMYAKESKRYMRIIQNPYLRQSYRSPEYKKAVEDKPTTA